MTHQLYVISCIRDGLATKPVKVGITSNISKRMKQLQTASPYQLQVAFVFSLPDWNIARECEIAFHTVKKAERTFGEWFDIEPLDAVMMMAICIEQGLRHYVQDQEIVEAGLKLSGVNEAKLFALNPKGRA